MVFTSSTTACIPWVSISAAAELTLKSPRSLVFDVQDDKLPDSNPSLKITSDAPGVLVIVGINVTVVVGV